MKNVIHLSVFFLLFTIIGCKTEMGTVDCDDKNYPSINVNGTLYVQPNTSPGFTNTYTWQEAIDYCNELDFEGCDDWYLPNKEELHALFTNKTLIGDFAAVDYWSSTHHSGIPEDAFMQDFADNGGNPSTRKDYDRIRCRCVRK